MSFPELDELLSTTPTEPAMMAGGGVAYDGSNISEKLGAWRPAIRSADADIIPEKHILDVRSRDTLRNDAYVAGGSAVHKDNIVGANFLLNAKPETKVLFGRDDETWETEFQEEVETKFTLWAESPSHWVDAARKSGLTALVRLAVGTYTAGGEVLATAEWMRNDGRPFRTAIQMIDTDRLSDPQTIDFRARLRGGVEQDRYGAPVAYHIRKRHPGDLRLRTSDWLDAYDWARVPARKPWGRQMVLHIFEPMRPDQSRGVASMATALTEMRMLKAFRKTELERAVVAATYAASIESDLPTGDAYAAMGAGADSNPTTAWLSDYLEQIAEYSGGAKNLHMNGAKIPVFLPGTHLKIQNPGANGPMGDKFEQSLLRHVAASLGVSYPQLSKDYSRVNYSSQRADMAETWRGMQSRKKIVADRTANFIYRLWMEEAINGNQIETLKRPNLPAFYEGLNADAYCACEWIGAGQGMIDPLKETQADLLSLKGGLTTKEAVITRRTGGDYRKVAKQISREKALDAGLGLHSVYDQDSQDVQNSLTAAPRDGDKNE